MTWNASRERKRLSIISSSTSDLLLSAILPLVIFLGWGLQATAQVNTPSCNSACINYLTALTNEKNIENAAVWDYSGPVDASQIDKVCVLADPPSCCGCGGIGLDSNKLLMLDRWAVTCNTFNSVQDGGASAVACWTGHFQQGSGCVDYQNLMEGATCVSGSAGTGQESSSVVISTSSSAPSNSTSMILSNSSVALSSGSSQVSSPTATSSSGSTSTVSSASSSPTATTVSSLGVSIGLDLDVLGFGRLGLTLMAILSSFIGRY